jgi:predicted nuclease of predicted toxin-antitoxin system
MNIKLDENLPESLVDIFARYGHQAVTVPREGLAGLADEPLFDIAKTEGRLFVTLDLDFSYIRAFPPSTHPGIIVIRPRSKGRNTVVRIVQSLLQKVAIETLSGVLAVVNETNIRIRKGHNYPNRL